MECVKGVAAGPSQGREVGEDQSGWFGASTRSHRVRTGMLVMLLCTKGEVHWGILLGPEGNKLLELSTIVVVIVCELGIL